jgi:hypothetical protein
MTDTRTRLINHIEIRDASTPAVEPVVFEQTSRHALNLSDRYAE